MIQKALLDTPLAYFAACQCIVLFSFARIYAHNIVVLIGVYCGMEREQSCCKQVQWSELMIFCIV